MWLPKTGNNWIASFKWVEVAQYSSKKNSVLRFKRADGENLLISVDAIEKWREGTSNNGLYTSVYQHSKETLVVNNPYLGNLYFDLDNESDPDLSRLETIKLYEYLLVNKIPEQAIHIFFTGLKGFHIEVEAYALGVVPHIELAAVYRAIADKIRASIDLTALDMQVYDPRRMWRLVGSQHQKTSLYKIPLQITELHQSIDSIRTLAQNPREFIIEDQTFNLQANLWYREHIYEYEEKKTLTKQGLLERFNREGTKSFQDIGEMEMEFDPLNLFTNCHAMKRLWEKAETTKNLEHEERLFLCSILTYTDEAIEYLHAILSQCDDYSWERSNAHITDWIARRKRGIGGRPYTCERANSVSIGCMDCHLEAKSQYYRVGDKLLNTGETARPSPIRYAYSYKRKKKGDS